MRIGAIEDIYTALSRNGELEFDWGDKSYIIQVILEEKGIYLDIWTTYLEPNNICLFEEDLSNDGCITKEAIDRAFNAKIFDGKSFFEIEPNSELTWMFGSD